MATNPQKYMNPITFEAEMFVNNLETLSKKYAFSDAVLVKTLEKVMFAIDTFLDKAKHEILATEATVLMECDNVKHIKTIYHCSRCKMDLGKNVEKATLHLIESCSKHGATGGSRQTSEINSIVHRNAEKRSKEKTIFEARKERKAKKREKRMSQAVKLTKKTRAFLSTDFNSTFFADHIKIGTKLQSIPEYTTIENDLESIVAPLYPDQSVRIYPFGSRLAGIATRESDLDLFMDIGGTYNKFQNRGDPETLAKLRKVERALNQSKLFNHMKVIDKARVPILRVIHARSGIECDINFSNSLGNINTKFLQYIFNLQPIARLMSIYLKKWLNRTNLNNEICTYAFLLMTIFYLQNENVLPSMEVLQQNVNAEKSLTVGPWLCSYVTMNLNELNIPVVETTEKKVKSLVKGFFDFYTKFDYQNVVCPYLGRAIKRSEVEKRMPIRYINYVKSHRDCALEMANSLVIQDPIQLNHNVTKSLTAFNHQIILAYMVKSLQVINETFSL